MDDISTGFERAIQEALIFLSPLRVASE